MRKYIFLFFLLVIVLFGIYIYQGPSDWNYLLAKYSDESSHFVELNGLNVHYKKKGEGMPIILIHGTSSSLHTWEKWENILSKKYTTYSIDMQGGGLTSPPADNDYSIQAYLNLIDAFVEKLEIDSFYLAGNSLGGHTAWAYAAKAAHADRVKKLILVDPSGFFLANREKPLVFQMAQIDFLFNNIEKINTGPFVGKSLREVYYNDDLVTPELIERYTDLGQRAGNRKAFFYKVRQIEKGDVDDLKKITCPTLILWGENDIWIPLELASIFQDNIPNSELIVYSECGHVPMEEKAEESAQDVLNFLN
ncbi:MAG: alpha/beta hydrolase [Chitinophagales bacterium]|nr:alpha/beta hydrolase [Chitinophagales bacterium]